MVPGELFSVRGHGFAGKDGRGSYVTPRSVGRSDEGAEQRAKAVAGVLHGEECALRGGQADARTGG
jgi:hypothetical protein